MDWHICVMLTKNGHTDEIEVESASVKGSKNKGELILTYVQFGDETKVKYYPGRGDRVSITE